jgi:hypothetical protein
MNTFQGYPCASSNIDPPYCAAPYLEFPELSLISYVNPKEKYLAFESQIGTTSQIYSQGKLTTLRREN